MNALDYSLTRSLSCPTNGVHFIPDIQTDRMFLLDRSNKTMRKSRFSEEQIIRVLQEVESGRQVKEVCREHGLSTDSYYRWKAKYGGMDVNEARRLKELEQENRRLKSALAEVMLDKQALKEALKLKMVKPTARRVAVKHFRDNFGLSERRACDRSHLDEVDSASLPTNLFERDCRS